MNLRRRQKAASEVYSHSLNDIMFFLLLFFLITSTMATPSVLKLLLPNSKTGIQSVKHPVVIAVTADMQFVVDQNVIPREGVEAAVAAAVAGQVDPTALLKVDKSVPWQEVVFLLDIGNKNKIKMVAATNLTKEAVQ
ncbi:MAG: biopolymer transporter ExbD [Bacteroidia bacterium]|jgi:biopolymer transport protein ExbD|nr:biopolymer transporter ExbD [Bacteroidota bacterium]MBP6512842.1 biopolymer transporter ExbD [Bacteroidia bacterium]MBP7245651.1 biopolymer transporter ExbD [Bacteroidia bacterium]